MSAGLAAAALIAAALLTMLAVSAHNYFAFPRLQAPPDAGALPTGTAWPTVSVLIPARNEAAAIGVTVAHLLAQEYPGSMELLVLDDQSEDGTAAAAQAAAEGDSRLRVLEGRGLPTGWAGKPWACHQLAGAACGELLLFTDADVRWQPGALAASVRMLGQSEAGLLTVWPTQELGSWAERLVVPLMSFAVLAYLPVVWVHRLPQKQAAAANGQCLLFRRATYQACGGHEVVRARVLDDVLLAQAVKGAGHALRTADAGGLIRTRMYSSWQQVRDGYAKNILAGHGGSIMLLLLSTFFHLGVFVLPWLWLMTGRGPGWPLVPAALVALGLTARTITAATARQPLADALLMPVSVLMMTRIAFQAIGWKLCDGGPVWKGRVLRDA